MASFSSEVFDAFLKQGLWHPSVDDNVQGERLEADLIRRIVTNYRAQPEDAVALNNMGLFALALGVAEWGVSSPDMASLPSDPAGKKWASDTGPDSGKHLMSYAIGGIGVSHADVGDLERIIRDVAEDRTLVPAEHAPMLLRLADRQLYKPRNGRHAVIYDEIRAAGLCGSAERFDTDLLDEPFHHFDNVGVDCARHANPKLTATDWRIFRTWMRAAIRTKKMQERLMSLWLEDYWKDSLATVPRGDGYMEEVLINVRVRNSTPVHADRAVKRRATTIVQRVQRELDQYGEFSLNTLKRRCRLMLRPVVLFRHFAGERALDGITCPAGSR